MKNNLSKIPEGIPLHLAVVYHRRNTDIELNPVASVRLDVNELNLAAFSAGLVCAHHQYPGAFGHGKKSLDINKTADYLLRGLNPSLLAVGTGRRIDAGIYAEQTGLDNAVNPGVAHFLYLYRLKHAAVGTGKILLHNMMNLVAKNGAKKISLEVVKTNKDAIRLYESIGFSVVSRVRTDKGIVFLRMNKPVIESEL